MANLTQSRNAAQKNAQNYFRKADAQPETLVKQARKKERVAAAANTAKLRELRLAKEAAEKQDKDNLAAESGEAPRAKRANAVRSVVRMTY
jgi:hypothetical protein